MYQDKIFMQGVRHIGTDNKIFLSEQAPTEYFIIHSCMSHSNSKMQAISTVKHLSRNYASFQQPSVQEWYSLSTSSQAQSIPQRNTADFHGDGYFPAERRYFQRLSNRFESVQNTLTSVWMLTLNTVIFKLILLSLKRKRQFKHTPNPLYFQRCRFTSWDVSRHFMHTIFPANRFVTPTHIVTAVTPVTAHSRNQ